MLYIGIDPGKAGGIAWRGETGEAYSRKLFVTYEDNWRTIEALLKLNIPTHILVEKVHSMPTQGVVSTFSFGTAFGHAKSLAAISCSIYDATWELVTPQRWQKHMGLIIKGKVDSTVKKNRHKQLALRYTKDKVTHAVSDAILIAQYNYEVNSE